MWLALLLALLPLLEELFSWLVPLGSADGLDPVVRAKMASVFKRMNLIQSQAHRIGMDWNGTEVQNAP
jgi:hypothetical protein